MWPGAVVAQLFVDRYVAGAALAQLFVDRYVAGSAVAQLFVDRYVAGCCRGPAFCVRSPSAVGQYIFLMYKEVKVPCHI